MNINEYQNYHETKAHTSAEFPYNTYLCSIPLDFPRGSASLARRIGTCCHQKKGQGFVSVDFDKRLVHSGDIIMIRPGCLHAIEQDDTFKMEYENIIFKPSLLSSGANDLCMLQYIIPLLDGSLPIEFFLTPALGSFEALSNCIRQIDLVCADQTPGWQLAVKSSLFNIFLSSDL